MNESANPRQEALILTEVLKKKIQNSRSATLRASRTAVERVATTRSSSTSHSSKNNLPPISLPSIKSVSLEPAAQPTLSSSTSAEEKLRLLREEIGDCQRCPLGKSRIQLVYGVGNPEARVLFIGEGPGYAEDRQGEPFVGPAGKLLDKILEATHLSRVKTSPSHNWVYIANMVKCHPLIDPSDNTKRGNDRPPTPEEMAVCSPFLMKQIQILRPWFIVALGATAGKALLKTDRGISTFRGQWSDFSPPGDPTLQIRFLPTYHPAALLRNPSLKKDVWEDMKKLRAELDRRVVEEKSLS